MQGSKNLNTIYKLSDHLPIDQSNEMKNQIKKPPTPKTAFNYSNAKLCVFVLVAGGPDGGLQMRPARASTTSSSTSSTSLAAAIAGAAHLSFKASPLRGMRGGEEPNPYNHHHHQHHPHSHLPMMRANSVCSTGSAGSPTASSSSPSVLTVAAAAAAAAAHHHHQHHHQMSYHNMFSPTRELAGTMWRCRTCGKEVTNRWHHFHSHTAQRSVCPYCPATYSRIDTLRSHLRVKHPDRLIKNDVRM